MSQASHDLFAPMRSAGVSEAIVRRIGELIGCGELRPGDRLPPEAELARAFEVAPMTVRTALQVLRDHGLIETRRGRGGGTFVHDAPARAPYFQDAELPTVEEFEDFTLWRETVSGKASALVAARFAAGGIAPAERERLLQLTEATHTPGLPPDAFRLADAELHRYVAELSRSQRLIDAERGIQALLTQTLRHMAQPPDTARLSAQAHTALVTAIVDGRAEDAQRALAAHVRSTLDLMVGFGYLTTRTPLPTSTT